MSRARILTTVVAAILIAAAVLPARAVLPSEMLADPALEARARALSAELRCLVCQNQSIDDSDAPLAADLRVLLRERIAAGDSDEQVMNYLVDRYGAFILLKPQFGAETAVLWAAPFVVLLIAGGVALYGYRFRRRALAAPAPLDAAEQESLERLISANPGDRNITES